MRPLHFIGFSSAVGGHLINLGIGKCAYLLASLRAIAQFEIIGQHL